MTDYYSSRHGNNVYLLDRVGFAALPILAGSRQLVCTSHLVCTEAKSPPLQDSWVSYSCLQS